MALAGDCRMDAEGKIKWIPKSTEICTVNKRHPRTNHRKDEKTMKRNATRILTLVLAIALIISMSLPAFAMDGHEVYLSPATGTSYTTMVDATTSTVSLEVYFSAYDATIADASAQWYNTGFNSATDAEAVQWSVPAGGNPNGLISPTISVTSGTVNSLTTSKATVTLNPGVSGVAIVHAEYSPSMTLDLVIARDEEEPADASVSTKVYVVDVSGATGNAIVNNANVSVCAPATEASSLSGILLDMEGAFQNQATAMGTLDVLLKASNNNITSVTLSDDGSYANAINGLNYWSYAVYDASGNLVPLSQNISASIFVLPASNYTVVWKYGGWSFASTLNDVIGEDGNITDGEISSWDLA